MPQKIDRPAGLNPARTIEIKRYSDHYVVGPALSDLLSNLMRWPKKRRAGEHLPKNARRVENGEC